MSARVVRRAAALLVAAAGWATCLWVLWGPVLRRLDNGASVNGFLKDYYLSDQFAYMSVARNIQDGLAVFVEPYTLSGSSIAPSAYYWVLGTTANLADLTIFGAWNAVGIAVTLLLLGMATAWSVWTRPAGLAWCVAPAGLLTGTLLWWTTDGGWMAKYGDHAVLWAPTASLFSPGAEGPGLVLSGLALLALAAALSSSGRRALLLAGTAGLLLGLVLETQTYVAMFTATAMVFTACAHEALVRPGRRWMGSLIAAVGVLLITFALLSGGGAVAKLLMLLGMCSAFLVARRAWRQEHWREAAALVLGAGAAGSLLLVRIGRQALDPDSFFYVRQELALDRRLALPPEQVLLQFLPTWLLVALAVVYIARRDTSGRRAAWLASLVGLSTGGALLVFNESWNFNTEPYRFLPYATVLLPVAAVPALYAAVVDGGWTWRGAGVGVIAAAVLTIPTTLSFMETTRDRIFAPSAQERAAYGEIMARSGGELTAFDSCFRAELVKVVAGGRVLTMNRGLAIPERYETALGLIERLAKGRLPRTEALRDYGIDWLVSTNHCDGIPASLLRDRFGSPIRIPLRNAAAVGAPPDLTYEMYSVGSPAT